MPVVAGLVSRVTLTPPTVTTAVTLAVKVPATLLLIVNVQVATLPLIVGEPQVVLVPRFGAGLIVGVIAPNTTARPAGLWAVTVIRKVCAWPTALVADGGVMPTLASTQFLVRLPLLPAVPLV